MMPTVDLAALWGSTAVKVVLQALEQWTDQQQVGMSSLCPLLLALSGAEAHTAAISS